jgi:peptidoglycan/LPS O-acetylase OafA/YrhL
MKTGDKWNWAFAIAGIVLLASYLQFWYLQVLFEWVGGYHNSVSGGIALFGLPFLLAPVLLAFAGIAALSTRSTHALIGTAIGLALYYPVLIGVVILGGFRSLAAPCVAAALLILGFVWTTGRKKLHSNQASDATSEPAPGADSSAHQG